MRKLTLAIVFLFLNGCASQTGKRETYDLINAELSKAAQSNTAVKPVVPDAVSASLLPPISVEVPQPKQPIEERFNLALNNVPAQQFFMAITQGTRYSMLVHPEVRGAISANLNNVTVLEAMDAIREMYGYDYRVEGNRIYVKPLTLQTRVFQVNYLTGNRKGTSDIRVNSGSIGDSVGGSPDQQGGGNTANNSSNQGRTSRALESSKINTTSNTDFWADLKASLDAIVGTDKEGRSVVISPQSGVVVVRGMWDELQNVAAYLKASQLSVDRQVVIEAKILEVQLNEGFQSGINWAAFRNGNNSRVSGGMLSPGTVLQPNGSLAVGASNIDAAARTFSGGDVISLPGQDIVQSGTGFGGLFGLAFQTSNFAALLSFLESQGKVHVLSSPRIATLNNQKAVLKVGTDEFFITNVTTTTTSSAGSTTSSPTLTLQPFFSGIALDVTPQIDDKGFIILHIHPSVSNVTTVDKVINLGQGGTYRLPLPSSVVSETDSVVRGLDGHIVAIGGLMRQATVSDRSQLPGVGDVPVVGELFKNKNQVTQKRELVILLKPTVVKDHQTWNNDILDTNRRIEAIGAGRGS
jgi:MSHA biogenesis protein MshL